VRKAHAGARGRDTGLALNSRAPIQPGAARYTIIHTAYRHTAIYALIRRAFVQVKLNSIVADATW